MFGKWFKREKPRVFLGTLAVLPRTDLKRHIEYAGTFQFEELESILRATLQEAFSLTSASDVSDLRPTDLGLDIFLVSFQSGGALFEIYIPFFWRPKVTVTCRLYYLLSQKTKRTYSITQKMPWGEFTGRLFGVETLRLRPPFSAEDLNRLLHLACHSLLDRLARAT